MNQRGKHFKKEAQIPTSNNCSSELKGSRIVLIIGGVFALLRIALSAFTPMVPAMGETFDDLMLARYAGSIQSEGWLGPYSKMTLAKNPGFSFILLIPSSVGISYQIFFSLLFIVGGLLFVRAIRPLVSSPWARLTIFCALMFLPPMLTFEMFQRVYRMGITIPFVLALFSSYIAIYLRREESTTKLVPWYLTATFSLAGFYYIKEDSIWVLPFIGTVSIILLLFWLIRCVRKRQSTSSAIVNIILLAVPLAATVAFGHLIKVRNLNRYGIYTTCERSDSAFSAFTSKLLAIDAGDSNPDVWVTSDAYELAFQHSPTFASIQNEMEAALEAWGDEENNVYGDHAFWALRDAYEAAGGYVDAKATNDFWQKAADELEDAFASGTLKRKSGFVISSTAPPIDGTNVPRLFSSCIRNATTLLSLSLTRITAEPGNGNTEDQLMAAKLINGPATLTSATYPLPWPQRIALKISNIVLAIERLIARPIAAMMVLCLLALATVSFAKRYENGLHALLIVLGLLLSCMVLIIGVSWSMMFNEHFGVAEWAAYMYCASCYPLLFMGGAITVGTLVQYFANKRSAR